MWKSGKSGTEEQTDKSGTQELWDGITIHAPVPEFQIQNSVPDIPDFHIPFSVFGCGFAALCHFRAQRAPDAAAPSSNKFISMGRGYRGVADGWAPSTGASRIIRPGPSSDTYIKPSGPVVTSRTRPIPRKTTSSWTTFSPSSSKRSSASFTNAATNKLFFHCGKRLPV